MKVGFISIHITALVDGHVTNKDDGTADINVIVDTRAPALAGVMPDALDQPGVTTKAGMLAAIAALEQATEKFYAEAEKRGFDLRRANVEHIQTGTKGVSA